MAVSLETWFQGASALFTAIAAIAAAWAAFQVRATSAEDRRLRITAHLRAIHSIVSDMAGIRPDNAPRLQDLQLDVRPDVKVVPYLLPRCVELVNVNLWEADGAVVQELIKDAMDEVEAAMDAVWRDADRPPWFRRWWPFRRHRAA